MCIDELIVLFSKLAISDRIGVSGSGQPNVGRDQVTSGLSPMITTRSEIKQTTESCEESSCDGKRFQQRPQQFNEAGGNKPQQ